jgi:hypothetical protein
MNAVMSMLFVFALLARGLIAAVLTHWVCVGMAAAFRDDLDRAVDISFPISILVVLASVAGVPLARRQPAARSRMAEGPRHVSQWRPLVLAIGFSSALGGLMLRAPGSQQAAFLAIGLGATMVIFEMAAAIGATIRGDSGSLSAEGAEDPTRDPVPMQLPSWVPPLVYWTTIGPWIVLIASRVAITPLVLLLAALGLSEEALAYLYWPIWILGGGVGLALAWVVWRQIRGYLASPAA